MMHDHVYIPDVIRHHICQSLPDYHHDHVISLMIVSSCIWKRSVNSMNMKHIPLFKCSSESAFLKEWEWESICIWMTRVESPWVKSSTSAKDLWHQRWRKTWHRLVIPVPLPTQNDEMPLKKKEQSIVRLGFFFYLFCYIVDNCRTRWMMPQTTGVSK